ncbi:unnamed protein product [Closterium sp. Yama58-4]|nr:unnamed protein product [Closterium sp. Yama58-4]
MARRSYSRGGQAGAFPAALSTEHRGSFRVDDSERKAHHPSLHKLPRGARVVLLAGTVIVTFLGFAAFALSGSFRQALLSQLRPSSANPSADLALEVDSTTSARGDEQVAEERGGEIRAAEGEVNQAEGEGGGEGEGGTEGEQQGEKAGDREEETRGNEGRRRKSRGKRRRRRRVVQGDRDKWVTELRKKPSWRVVSGFQGVPATHLIADSNSLACALVATPQAFFTQEIRHHRQDPGEDGHLFVSRAARQNTAAAVQAGPQVGTFAGNLSRILFGAATPLIPGRRLHWGDEPHLCFGEVIFPLHTAYSTNATEYVRRKAYAWADARLTAAVTGAPADDTGDTDGAAGTAGAATGADAGEGEEADSEDGEEAEQQLQQRREAEEKRREEQLSKLPSPLQVTWLYRSNRRTITNVGDVLQLLTTHFRMPIHIIELSESTPFDQVVHTMRHTAFAIGMHGSALANLIFLPSGASCLELIPYKYRYFPYLTIAPLFNINYHQWTNEKREFASFDDGCFEGKWAKLSPSDCWKLRPCLRCVRDHARTHVDPESIGPVLADIGREVRIWIGMYGLPAGLSISGGTDAIWAVISGVLPESADVHGATATDPSTEPGSPAISPPGNAAQRHTHLLRAGCVSCLEAPSSLPSRPPPTDQSLPRTQPSLSSFHFSCTASSLSRPVEGLQTTPPPRSHTASVGPAPASIPLALAMAADETTDGDDEARRHQQKSLPRTGLSFLQIPAKKLLDPEPVVASTEDEAHVDEAGRDLRSPEVCTTTTEPEPPEATAPETEIGDAAGDSANKKRKESSNGGGKPWWRQPKPSSKRSARPIRRVEDAGSDDDEDDDGLPTVEEMARYPEIAFAKAHKRFKTSWESLFSWLILTRDDVGFPILRCSTCLEHGAEGAKTAYGKGGSGGRDMQKGSIRTHQRSTAHQDAHAETKSKLSRKLRQTMLSEFEGLDRSTHHIITALKTTVFICKSEAPITSYVGTIKFMAELGVPNLPLDSKGNYFSE